MCSFVYYLTITFITTPLNTQINNNLTCLKSQKPNNTIDLSPSFKQNSTTIFQLSFPKKINILSNLELKIFLLLIFLWILKMNHRHNMEYSTTVYYSEKGRLKMHPKEFPAHNGPIYLRMSNPLY